MFTLPNITPDLIRRYQEDLEISFSPATVKRKLMSLKKFLDWAQPQAFVEQNPLTRIQGPRIKIKDKKIPARFAVNVRKIPGAMYLSLAVLVILSAAAGLGIYNQFFKNAQVPSAFTSLVPPNRYLSFQGRLTNQFGNPVTGPTSVVFKLYDDPTAGTDLWTSSPCTVSPDTDGVFSILMGSDCGPAITSTVFSDNAGVWLGVKVSTDAEALPRVQIATVAYSLNSETLQGYPASASATVNTIPVITNSGTMVLALSSPKIQSTTGNFAIEGQVITINTPTGSNGSITIAPNGTGSANLTFTGASPGNGDGMVNATDANLTSGALYYGSVASNATGYDLVRLQSGSPLTTKFSVNNAGNTYIAGTVQIAGGTPGSNKVLTSDTVGLASWTDLSTLPVGNADTVDSYHVTAATNNYLTKFVDSTHLGASAIFEASGNVGIGTTGPTGRLEVGGAITSTSLSGNSVFVTTTGNSSGTTYLSGFQSYLSTAASAYTVGSVYNFVSNDLQTKGAGSAVTNMYGFNAQTMASGTNNYGFWTNQAAGANNYSFYGGAAQSYFNGNVGIGTTGPAEKLEVAGGINITSTATSFNHDGLVLDLNGLIGRISVGSQGPFDTQLDFYTAATGAETAQMRLGSNGGIALGSSYVGTAAPAGGMIISGNVGIGTTNPGYQLDVQGSNGYINALSGLCINGTCKTSWNTGSQGYWTGYGNNIANNNSGNVGIGTTSPSGLLSVTGNGYNGGTGLSDVVITGTGAIGAGITLNSTNVGGRMFQIISSQSPYPANGLEIVDQTANYGGGAVRLFIDSTGNVGIGTTSPGAPLHIQKNTAPGAVFQFTGTATDSSVDNSNGVGMFLTHNDSGNRQFVIADTSSLAGVRFLGNGIDGWTNGSRTDLGIGTETNGAHIATAIGNTQFSVNNVGGTASKIVTEIKGAAAQSGNYLNISSSSGNGDILTINSSGNVGIGTTAPGYQLDVQGSNGYVNALSGLCINGTCKTSWNTGSQGYWTGYGNDIANNNSGNVGIGTTSPGQNLEVYETGASSGANGVYINSDRYPALMFNNRLNGSGDVGGTGKLIYNSVATGYGADSLGGAMLLQGSNALQFSSGGDNVRMTIGSTGKIGIGTTNPVAKLQISGLTGEPSLVHTAPADLIVGHDSGVVLAINHSDSSPYGMSLQTRNIAVDNQTYPLLLNPLGGNIGIGTTSPGSILNIKSATPQETIQDSTDYSGSQHGGDNLVFGTLKFTNPNSDNNYSAIVARYNPTDASFARATELAFETGQPTSERMRITSTGNVGIGTTNPGYQLDVQGSNGYVNALSGLCINGTCKTSWSTGSQGYWTGYGNDIANNNSGNVGIGTTSPGTPLHVLNSAAGIVNELTLQNATTANSNSGPGLLFKGYYNQALISSYENPQSNYGGNLLFQTYNHATPSVLNTGMIMDYNGNVGIGTTNPQAKLELSAGPINIGTAVGSALAVNNSGYTTKVFLATGWNGTIGEYTDLTVPNNSAPAAKLRMTQAGYSAFGYDNPGTATLAINGNVGIGTTSPGTTLSVVKTSAGAETLPLYVSNLDSTANTAVGMAFSAIANGVLTAKIVNSYSGTYYPLAFYNYTAAGLTEKMRIDDSGNVGIGTTAPGALLDVAGKIKSSTFQMTTGGTSGYVMQSDATGNGSWASLGSLSVGNADTTDNYHISSATTNYLTKYTDSTHLGASGIFEVGGNVGLGTTSPLAGLHTHYSTYNLDVSGLPNTRFASISDVLPTGGFTLTTSIVPDFGSVGVVGIAGRVDNDGGNGIGVLGIGLGSYQAGYGGKFYAKAFPNDAVQAYGIYTEAVSISGQNGYAAYLAAGSGAGTNWGLYQAGASDKNYFAGNVGIGTTGPGQALDISGNGKGLRISDTSNYYLDISQIYDASPRYRIAFNVSDAGSVTETMTLRAGNVGIGTTNPGYQLDVQGSNGYINALSGLCINGTCKTSWSTGSQGYWTGYGNDIANNNSGNVGIGTTTPGNFKLAIKGSDTYSGDPGLYAGQQQGMIVGNGNGGTFAFNNDFPTIYSRVGLISYANQSTSDGGSGAIGIAGFANNATAGAGSPAIAGFFKATGGTDTYGIYSVATKNYFSGNVGIGTTNPASGLDVQTTTPTAASIKTLVPYSASTGTITGLYVSPQNSFATAGLTALVGVKSNPSFNYALGDTGTGASVIAYDATNSLNYLPGIAQPKEWITYNQSYDLGQITDFPTYYAKWGNRFYVKGNGDVYINGNLGIGTTAPGEKLAVTGNIYSTGLQYGTTGYYNGSLSTGWNYGDGTQFAIRTGSTDNRVVVSSTGNVGIGTTNPGYQLDVQGSNGYVNALSGLCINGTCKTSWSTGSQGYWTGYGNDIANNNSGNVGIGTTSPAVKLSLGAGAADTAASKLAVYEGGASNYYGIGLSYNGTLYGLGLYANGTTTGAPQVFLNTSGSVGIGTTAPGNRLVVNDSTAQAQAVFYGYSTAQSRTAADSGTIQIGNTASYHGNISYSGASNTDFTFDNTYDNAAAITQFRMRTSGTPVTALTILGSGNIGIGTTSPTSKLYISGSTGNLFTINDATSDLVNVSSVQTTINNPTFFTSSGDVSVTYDLLFNNPDSSYIKSAAPLYIQAGETYDSSDLTLRTFNSGDIVMDAGGVTSATGTVKFNDSNVKGATVTTPIGFAAASSDINTFRTNFTNETIIGSINEAYSAAIGGTGGVWTDAGTYIYPTSAGATAMTIMDNGNVGIGTTNPQAILDIGGANVTNTGRGALSVYSNNGGGINTGGQISFGGDASAYGYLTYANIAGRKENSNMSSADGYLQFSTMNPSGGVLGERMRITGSGNVGIGTTSPAAKLDISGASSAWGTIAAINLDDTAGNANSRNWAIINGTNYGDLAFSVGASAGATPNNGGSVKMTIDKSGNVGIGTTGPGQKLMVAGDTVKIGVDLVGNTAGYTAYDLYEAGVEKATIQLIGSTFATTDRRGAMEFIGQGKLDFHADGYSATPDMRITSGNVGIGTTSPGYKLDLGTSGGKNLALYSGVGDFYGFGISASTMEFYAQGTGAPKMVINSGNVGIGTTGPTAKLSILDSAVTDEQQFTLGVNSTYHLAMGHNTAGNTISYIGENWNSDASRFDIRMKGFTSSDAKLTVLGSGNVGIGTTGPTTLLELSKVNGSGIGPEITLRNGNGGGASAISFIGYDLATQPIESQIKFIEDGNFSSHIDFLTKANSTGGALSEKVRITSAGNVGIGTTSPGSQLNLFKATATEIRIASAVSSGINLYYNNGSDDYPATTGAKLWYDAGSAVTYLDNQYAYSAGQTWGDIQIRTAPVTAGTEVAALTVKASGNVGIGTASPYSTLDVAQATSGTGEVGTVGGRIMFSGPWYTVTPTNLQRMGGIQGYKTIGSGAFGGGVQLLSQPNSGGAPIVALTTDHLGNVGIGTTAPGALLDVAGKIKSSTFQMTTGGTSGYVMQSDATGNGTWSSLGSLSVGNADTTDYHHLNQDVLTTSSPTFAGLTLNGPVYGGYIGTDGIGYNTSIGQLNDFFIRADERYTVTADAAFSNVSSAFDGNDSSPATISTTDVNSSPRSITIDFGAVNHYWKGFRVAFYYGSYANADSFIIEGYVNNAQDGNCSNGTNSWQTIADVTGFTGSEYFVNGGVNYTCKVRLTLRHTNAAYGIVGVTTFAGYHFYYGGDGLYLQRTGDTMYGNLAIGTAGVNRTLTVNGLINGQTISSTANFTGTVNIASTLTVNGGGAATTPYSNLNGLRISGGDTSNTIWNAGRNIVISADTGHLISLTQTSAPTTGLIVDTTSGNVGIGTTAPLVKLDVNGQTDINGQTANGISHYQWENAIYRNPADHTPSLLVREDNSTTGINGFKPALSLYNNDGSLNSTVGLAFVSREAAGSGNAAELGGIMAIKEAAGIANAWTQGGLNFYTVNAGTRVDALRILNSGNVGIGTTAPGALLDVAGKIKSSTFQMTTGGTSGYVMQSDVSGNGSWASLGSLSVGNADTTDSYHIGGDANYVTKFNSSNNTIVNSSIFDNGNVGIGTTAPTSKLSVIGDGATYHESLRWSGNSSYENSYFGYVGYDAAGATTAFIGNNYATTDSKFQIRIGADPKLTVTNEGNVGIGTTGPAQALHISRDGAGNGVSIEMQDTDVGTAANRGIGYFGIYQGGTYFQNATAGKNIKFITNGAVNAMTILDNGNVGIGYADPGTAKLAINGNVGIGTTGPGANLDVQGTNTSTNSKGNMFVSTTDNAAVNKGGQISLGGNWLTGTTPSTQIFGSIAGRQDVGNSGAGYLAFSTSLQSTGVTTEKMRIDNAGNVGIGTTSPTLAQLQVANSTSTTGLYVGSNASMSVPNIRSIGYASTNTNGGAGIELGDGSANSVNMYIMRRADNDFSILTSGTSTGNLYIQPKTNLLLNPTTGNVGIGTTAPSTLLELGGTHAYGMAVYDTITLKPALSTGTSSNPSSLGAIHWYEPGSTAQVRINAVADNLSAVAGTHLEFWTMNDGGTFLEKMRIDSGGNVGIGTTGPHSALEVRNGTDAEIILNRMGVWASVASGIKLPLDDALTTSWTFGMHPNSTNNMYLTFGGSDYLTVLTSGNVGIGTTSPVAQLQINAATNSYAATNGSYTGGGAGFPNWDAYYAGHSNIPGAGMGGVDPGYGTFPGGNAGGLFYGGNGNYTAGGGAGLSAFGGNGDTYSEGGAGIYAQGGTNGSWWVSNSGVASAPAGYFNGNVFVMNGNVGIGTTNPGAKLDVVGTIRATGGNTAYYAYLQANYAQNNAFQLGISGHNLITTKDDYYNGGTLQLWTSDTPQVTINSSGNVGIGTTAPAVKLDVQGGGNTYGANIYGLWTPDGNSLTRNWALNDGSNNYITSSGAGGTYTYISDSPLGSRTMRYSSNTYMRNAEWVPVDTTKTYKVSVWARNVSGTNTNYLSLTQANYDLSTPVNGGWGNPYFQANIAFPSAWTLYTMTIGPTGSGAGYTWSADTKYVQLGALILYSGSGVVEITGYRIEEITDTLQAGTTALGNLNLNGILYLNNGQIANSFGTASILLSSTPTTVANTLSASNWLIENTANVGQAALMVNQTKGGDIFTASASGTPKFVITNGGYVGIGTTAPAAMLSVGGTGSATARIDATGGSFAIYGHGASSAGVRGDSTGDSANGVYGTNNGAASGVEGYNTSTGNGVFGMSTNSSGTGVRGMNSAGGIGGYFSSTSGYALITNVGYVGIGITSPTVPLHVAYTAAADNIAILENTTTGQVRLSLQRSGDAGTGVAKGGVFYASSSGFGMVDYEARPLTFYTGTTAGAASERMRISNGGNVGIGTTAPSEALHVVGNIRVTSIASDTLWHYTCVDSTGVFSSGHTCNSSSIRYKENVRPIDNALEIVSQLKGVNFTWKPQYGGYNDIGFIAEDVGKIYPQLVSWEANGTDAIGLDYDKLTALLVNAVQEQQGEIASLSGQLANLTLTSTGDLNISQDVSGNYQLTNTSNNSIISQIAALGQLVAANIKAGAIITTDFVAENVNAGAVIASKITTDGFTAFQGTIDHLLITSGLVAGNIQTKLISPIADGTDVTVQIGTATESGKFAVQNSTGTEVASIDNSGNAAFAGNASVSGTLYADEIKSKSLDEIQALLAKVQTDQSLLAEAATWNINTATNSASLNELAVADLYITNQAAINSLSVTNTLTVGSDLVFQSTINNQQLTINSIDTLSAPLKLQSLAMAPVEIMAGLVTIDTHGNVNIAGNLFVAGKIHSSGLALTQSTQDQLGGVDATDSGKLLTLQDQTGTEVASVNASGSAQFGSVSTPQLVIAGSDATQSGTIVNGIITTNSTVGQAVIPTGVSEITIKNPKITDYTLVYVTPTSTTENYVLYVKSKQAGQFVVGFTNPIDVDVNFNWWIVQVQN